jgi:hypothetical protein
MLLRKFTAEEVEGRILISLANPDGMLTTGSLW